MIETTITRHNHLIDPHLHIWEWQIPIYLFLGGLAAGFIILAAAVKLAGKEDSFPRTLRIGSLIAPVAISLGMFMLLLDLSYKTHVFRFYMTFQLSSAMSWGAWILVLIYPANLLFIAGVWKLPPVLNDWFFTPAIRSLQQWAQANIRKISILNLALGIGLGIYTGVLLSGFVAMHLWNSGLLGPLFLISGASSAVALAVIMEKGHPNKEKLANIDRYLIISELVLIALLLIDLSSGCKMNQCASRFLIYADYSVFFWVFVVGLGLLLPLIIEIISLRVRNHKTFWLAPLLVLSGGLALRFLFVIVGQAVTCIQKGIL